MLSRLSKLAARSVRRGFLGSLLLLLSLVGGLSLLLLLHSVHLLHSGHSLPPAARRLGQEETASLARRLATAHTERNSTGQRCLHPALDPLEPSVMQFFQHEPPVDCSSAMDDWVYVTNGTFRISRRARRQHGKITCEYAPIVRGDDFSARHAPHVKPMPDGEPLKSDFFKVACLAASGKKYMNIHSGVARRPALLERLHRQAQLADSQPAQGLNLSVFMFGFDSLSRMAWLRLLPKTRRFLLQELGGVELEGYNILGDGTPAALLPILTGKMEEELPEARRGFPGAGPVDGHPWVWKEFSRRGFVTAHAEDMSVVGTFQYRMLGFREQPTDHNMRTFYLAAERMYKHNPPLCLGSRPRHLNFMHWFRQLFQAYAPFPKFFFGFHSEMSHDSNNKVQALDDDLVAFLRDLDREGHLNSTLLILMADHGARYNYIRATAQGKLEERMPYFSLRFPPWFRRQHPDILRNLHLNAKRLTTPFDVHETFRELLHYTGAGKADISKRGVSLFKEIPKERTCSQAEITPHWCACLEWQHVDPADEVVVAAARSAVNSINRYTKAKRTKCAELWLSRVVHGSRYLPTAQDLAAQQKLFSYRQAEGLEGGSTDTSPPPSPALTELYQVSFLTLPGLAHFEVTCWRDVRSGQFRLSAKDVSRINKYGTQPACIADTLPHLRPYCYCS